MVSRSLRGRRTGPVAGAFEPLRGRTVIVTGAGGLVGGAAAGALGRAGASVVLAAREARALEELAARIGAAGGQAIAVATDLADPVSVRRLVEQTLGAFGRLDAACNVTGRHPGCGNATERGPALAMRYEIASMRPGGSIVNVAPAETIVELTRTAARDHAGSGVRVNAVASGTAAEIAAAVVWLCSDDAAQVTGETLRLSG